MAVIKASPAPPATTDAFTPKEAEFLIQVLINNKAKLDIDWDKVASAMKYKDANGAAARWRAIAKKIATMGGNTGGEGENGTKEKADDITDGMGETTPAANGAKKPRAPRKRKAAEDGEAGGEAQVPKKRAKKDKATKVNAEVTDEHKAKEDADINDETDENDEASPNTEAGVEAAEFEEVGDV